MEIIYLGHASFRLRGKSAKLVTDPFDSEMVGLKYPRTDADIVTVSHDHKDHNKVDNVKNARIILDGPGEYEVQSVSIVGLSTDHDNKKGAERGKNTIFVIEMDGLRIAHLGDLGHKLSESVLEDIGTIDILLVPTGGVYTIGTSEAAQIVRDIEPAITIPMHFKQKGMKDDIFGELSDVEPFLSEVGYSVEKLDKLSVKKSDITDEKKIVVLQIK